MDSSHPLESARAGVSEIGTQQLPLCLPPGTPSDTSPSKPIPDIEAITLTVPAWRNTNEALEWFENLRKVLKSVTYRYGAIIQQAIQIFEDTGATTYRDHEIIQNHLIDLWKIWRQFTMANTITPEFLRTSAIYFDFGSIITNMKTPQKVARRYALQMGKLRANMKSIAIEVEILRGLIVEIDIRLRELEDGNDVEQFPELPEVRDDDIASERSIFAAPAPTRPRRTSISGTTIATQTDSTTLSGLSLVKTVSTQTQPSTVSSSHTENVPELEKSSHRKHEIEKEHEEEHGEEESEKDYKHLYYNFEVRTQNEMDLELFDPVWEPHRPFPGEIPAELNEYLGSPGSPRGST